MTSSQPNWHIMDYFVPTDAQFNFDQAHLTKSAQQPTKCQGFDLFFLKKPNALGVVKDFAKQIAVEVYGAKNLKAEITYPTPNPKIKIDNMQAKCVVTITWEEPVVITPMEMLDLNRNYFREIPGYTGSELYLEVDYGKHAPAPYTPNEVSGHIRKSKSGKVQVVRPYKRG